LNTKPRYQHAISFTQELENKWSEFKKDNPHLTMSKVFEAGIEYLREEIKGGK
jgi:hypothetical protein